MPVSAGMHESGPLRQGEGADTLRRKNFPRTAMGVSRDDMLH
jgi:hypothetical protein